MYRNCSYGGRLGQLALLFLGMGGAATISLSNSGSAPTQVRVAAVVPSGATGAITISSVHDAIWNMNMWSDDKERIMGPNPFSGGSDRDGIADPADPNPLEPEKKIPSFTSLALLMGLVAGFLFPRYRRI